MIPKIIWQTNEPARNDLPYPYNLNSKNWEEKNPTFKYKYSDGKQKRKDIEKYAPQLLECFDQITEKRIGANIWKYTMLAEFGGFYADLDCVCIEPLKNEYLQNQFIVQSKCYDYYCDICNKIHNIYNGAFFACTPKNPIIIDVINNIYNDFINIKKENISLDYTNANTYLASKYKNFINLIGLSHSINVSNILLTEICDDYICLNGNCIKPICHGPWHRDNHIDDTKDS